MDPSLVRRLNRVNREFYRRHAESFSSTRQAPWPGWDRVLEVLPSSGPESVLDLGCGNGRFARFLAARERFPRRYVGMDLSPRLLAKARRSLGDAATASRCRWLVADLLEPPPLKGPGFSLVLLLGVLHHVPGHATRARLLEAAAELVAPGGVLAVTVWMFDRSDRMRRRLLSSQEAAARLGPGVDAAGLEPGDYLMPWGAGSSAEPPVRYCHALSEAEADELSARLPLAPAADFEADGAAGNLNRYLLWRRG